jgi:3-isopropylmalate/(R)-2-methylmalate dehydratase large subunit
MSSARTLYEKIWDAHVVEERDDGSCLLLVDRHVLYEATSQQAFEGLRAAGRAVHRPVSTLAVADHTIPTAGRDRPLEGAVKFAIDTLARNCADFGVPYIDHRSAMQGICHVIAPELGFVQPGHVAVCGDSHTATLGALGALGFGIGTSEVEHVLATGTVVQWPSRTLRLAIDGELGAGVTAKDCILAMIGHIGASGGTGYVIEYGGEVFTGFSMEERMTVSNMSIEAGARAGMFAPDDTTFEYLEGRPLAPRGAHWDSAVEAWRRLPTDPGARYDRDVTIDGAEVAPQVTWGTSPEHVVPVTGRVPSPDDAGDPHRAAAFERALEYQGLAPGTPMTDVRVDQVFIGSCTNSRISDLRAAAAVLDGRHLAEGVTGIVVPGSGQVKAQAEAEGLDRVFVAAGLEWRDAGCSMCWGGGADAGVGPTRVASTSNRNFENRQGRGVRTHLVSPAMAAAAAVHGHFVDVRGLGT